MGKEGAHRNPNPVRPVLPDPTLGKTLRRRFSVPTSLRAVWGWQLTLERLAQRVVDNEANIGSA